MTPYINHTENDSDIQGQSAFISSISDILELYWHLMTYEGVPKDWRDCALQ